MKELVGVDKRADLNEGQMVCIEAFDDWAMSVVELDGEGRHAMSATLYEISADLSALEELLTEVGGELPR